MFEHIFFYVLPQSLFFYIVCIDIFVYFLILIVLFDIPLFDLKFVSEALSIEFFYAFRLNVFCDASFNMNENWIKFELKCTHFFVWVFVFTLNCVSKISFNFFLILKLFRFYCLVNQFLHSTPSLIAFYFVGTASKDWFWPEVENLI